LHSGGMLGYSSVSFSLIISDGTGMGAGAQSTLGAQYIFAQKYM